MKLHRVIITIYPPKDAYEGQVEEGQYTNDNGEVVLVCSAGVPVRDKSGKEYSRKLTTADDAHQIAGRLLKELYQSRRPKNRFSAPIHYPKLEIV